MGDRSRCQQMERYLPLVPSKMMEADPMQVTSVFINSSAGAGSRREKTLRAYLQMMKQGFQSHYQKMEILSPLDLGAVLITSGFLT